MKVFIDCECLLLNESLRLFLADLQGSKKECDFIISDREIQTKKPVFIINENRGHLNIPFTKDALISTLEEFYFAIEVDEKVKPIDSLEDQISSLIDNFKVNLINLIKERDR